MVAEKIELVNDAEPLIRDALAYPLRDTIATDQAKKLLDDGLAEVAQALLEEHKEGTLPACDDEDFMATYKTWVKDFGKKTGRKGKGLFMPLRVLLTGRFSGPDIPAQLHMLSLAPGKVEIEMVDLAERMRVLEEVVASLESSD